MKGREASQPIALIRSNWKFAASSQFLLLFQVAISLDQFDVDSFESELAGFGCDERYIPEIIMRLLKAINPWRSIDRNNWQLLVRKEFVKRARGELNPFEVGDFIETVKKTKERETLEDTGDYQRQGELEEIVNLNDQKDATEEPKYELESRDWSDLSITEKIHVIYCLCEWTMDDSNRFRELPTMPVDGDPEWRILPAGFDSHGNIYYVFDGYRLYREIPEAKAQKKSSTKKSRKRKRGRPSRRYQSDVNEADSDDETDVNQEQQTESTWQTVCVTLAEWENFPDQFKLSRNPDEKELYEHLTQVVLPKATEYLKEKEKERQMKDALIHRKRSSRLVTKELQQEAEIKRRETEQRRREEEERKQNEKHDKERLEKAREQRLREREDKAIERARRLQEREEQMQAKEMQRVSLSQNRKNRKSLSKRSSDTEQEWDFDCYCSAKGKNYDDGREMVSCDRCNVWQHTECVKIEASKMGKNIPSFDEFVCPRCLRKEIHTQHGNQHNEDSEVDVVDNNEAESKVMIKIKLQQSSPPIGVRDTSTEKGPKKPRKPREPKDPNKPQSPREPKHSNKPKKPRDPNKIRKPRVNLQPNVSVGPVMTTWATSPSISVGQSQAQQAPSNTPKISTSYRPSPVLPTQAQQAPSNTPKISTSYRPSPVLPTQASPIPISNVSSGVQMLVRPFTYPVVNYPPHSPVNIHESSYLSSSKPTYQKPLLHGPYPTQPDGLPPRPPYQRLSQSPSRHPMSSAIPIGQHVSTQMPPLGYSASSEPVLPSSLPTPVAPPVSSSVPSYQPSLPHEYRSQGQCSSVRNTINTVNALQPQPFVHSGVPVQSPSIIISNPSQPPPTVNDVPVPSPSQNQTLSVHVESLSENMPHGHRHEKKSSMDLQFMLG